MEETQEGSDLFSIALNTVNKKHLCFYVIPPLSIYSQQKERGDSVWSEESGKEENERKHYITHKKCGQVKESSSSWNERFIFL